MRSRPGFIESARYIFTGWQLINTKGLRRFVWIPLLINLAIFGGAGLWLYGLAAQWLSSWSVFSVLPDWWIVHAIQTLLHWMVAIVLFFSLAFLFTLVANFVGAPFNSLLAERVEAHLSGEALKSDLSLNHLVKSLPRLIGSELSKFIYLLVCLIPLLCLQFIPLVNVLAPFLLFMFGAWMFSLEYMDYPMGNHGALFRDVRAEMRKDRLSAFGFGTVVAFLSTLPVINLVIMPAAVAGATALYVDHYRHHSVFNT